MFNCKDTSFFEYNDRKKEKIISETHIFSLFFGKQQNFRISASKTHLRFHFIHSADYKALFL